MSSSNQELAGWIHAETGLSVAKVLHRLQRLSTSEWHTLYNAFRFYQETGELDPKLFDEGEQDLYHVLNIPLQGNKKRKAQQQLDNGIDKMQMLDDEHESLSNSPAEEDMSAHRSGEARPGEANTQPGAPQEGGEQQISPIKDIWTRFPNTQNTILRFVNTRFLGTNFPENRKQPWGQTTEQVADSLTNTSGGAFSNPSYLGLSNGTYGYDFTTPYLMQIRMTSPYNILLNLNGTKQTGAAGEGNSQPQWIELFDQKYQYYHQIECHWKLTFNFGVPNNGAGGNQAQQIFGYFVFWRYTNEDDPPVQYVTDVANIANVQPVNAFNQIASQTLSNAGGPMPLKPDDYMRMGGWHYKHVTGNTTYLKNITISGKYEFGQCKMDIKTLAPNVNSQSDTAEGWSKVGATAAFPENLSIIIVQDNAYTPQVGFKTPVSCRIETSHLIQWKDLRAPYKFPHMGYSRINADGAHLNTDIARS